MLCCAIEHYARLVLVWIYDRVVWQVPNASVSSIDLLLWDPCCVALVHEILHPCRVLDAQLLFSP